MLSSPDSSDFAGQHPSLPASPAQQQVTGVATNQCIQRFVHDYGLPESPPTGGDNISCFRVCVFQQGAGLINHRLSAGDAFRTARPLSRAAHSRFHSACSAAESGTPAVQQGRSPGGFRSRADNLHRHAGRNTGLNPLVFRMSSRRARTVLIS